MSFVHLVQRSIFQKNDITLHFVHITLDPAKTSIMPEKNLGYLIQPSVDTAKIFERMIRDALVRVEIAYNQFSTVTVVNARAWSAPPMRPWSAA